MNRSRHLKACPLAVTLALLSASPAPAATPRNPLLQLSLLEAPNRPRPEKITLMLEMKSGHAGTLSTFHTRPEFNEQGLLGTSPDAVFTRLNKPLGMSFHAGETYILFSPLPETRMKVSIVGTLDRKAITLGTLEITCYKDGQAAITDYALDRTWIHMDPQELARLQEGGWKAVRNDLRLCL